MFFLSGITMVLAMTFVLVYNADLMLGGLALTGGMMSTLVPSIRTAVAYPLANKFRTGMTIAMIALVMFALVMMSTMNGNFDRIFLSEDALGGYDVVASENPGNPFESLVVQLRAEGFNTDAIRTVDKIKLANAAAADVGTPDDSNGGSDDEDGVRGLNFDSYPIRGVSDGFAQNTTLRFQARANGFDSDDAVWKALSQSDEYAVIDAFAVPGGGFGDPGHFQLDGIEPADRTFEPIRVTVRDSATNSMHEVRIIGILHTEGSGLFGGLLLTDDAFDSVFAKPESSLHYARLQDGADPDAVAKGIEKTLLFQGVQAEALREIIEDFQAQSRGFLYLIQGFMGIGLFVGIAAVGVIAFRTVVERRQQIGMLRAIGYTRRAVALSFIMESSFTALLGIGSGIALGLLLAYQLVSTDDFVPGGIDSFYIPWLQIGLIGGFAFVASLVMTIIPARQASSIPIAEALRYE
jgi:putative ABC transport system permease protein